MTGFLSGEPKIRDAYESGKDLYAIIAQSAFHNEYWENLEFYPEGYEIEIDGKKIVSGSGKEFEVSTDADDSIAVKPYELLETPNGEVAAKDIQIGDIVLSDIGQLKVEQIIPIQTQADAGKLTNLVKLIFKEA